MTVSPSRRVGGAPVATRSRADASSTGMCGPPNGQPLPSVRSMRSPISFAFSPVNRSASKNSGLMYVRFLMPFSALSSSSA